jgi:succinate-acetate transporter protein
LIGVLFQGFRTLAPLVAGDAIGLYLIGWAIFTFHMTIARPQRGAVG